MKRKYFLLATLCLCMLTTFAQKSNPFTAFSERWEGQPFPELGSRQTIYGQPFSVDKSGKGMFVRLGFIGCHPCEEGLPDYVQLASAYPQVVFLYISYDDAADMKNEFKDYKVPANLYILSMKREEIDAKHLSSGYPSNFFVNAAGVNVKAFNGNHDMRDGRPKRYPYWKKILKKL